MAHRKWNETKQQPSMLTGPAVPGCCLVSFHILWAILCPQAVMTHFTGASSGLFCYFFLSFGGNFAGGGGGSFFMAGRVARALPFARENISLSSFLAR